MRTYTSICLLSLLLIALIAVPLAGFSAPDAPTETRPRVLMRTDLGDIVLEIYVDSAPITSANFLTYVDESLFGGAHFYRVVTRDNQPNDDVKIEVIQGGLGFDAEEQRPPIDHETTATSGVRHLDGVLSMARLGPGTASSEFFVCVGDQPELDFGGARNPDGQGFAAFGRVVEGMDVVRAIQQGSADEQMLIETVAISEIRRLGEPPALEAEDQSR